MGTAIKYQSSENLFHLWVGKIHIGLRRCGHICERELNSKLATNAYLECSYDPSEHANDCSICSLLQVVKPKKGG